MFKELDTYDWEHIFEEYCSSPNPIKEIESRRYFNRDVAKIISIEEGENDGADWLGLFEMNDGNYLALRAGCDYTGWGCREGGSSDVAATKADIIAFGLTPDERQRLGL